MNLLVFNYEFPPIGGGASTASYNLAKQFVVQGHKVDVLTCRISGQPKVEVIEGVTVYRVLSVRKGPHEASLFGAFTYLIAASFRLRKLIQLQQYHYAIFFFALPTALLSFYWRKKTKRPYIVCLRGSDVPRYDKDAKLVNFIHGRMIPITNSILTNAHKVLANSSSLRKLALDSFSDVPISVITNGVSQHLFKPVLSLNNTSETVLALCVSRLVKRKGINFLLQAVERSKIQNLQIWIAGTGPDELHLSKLAKNLGIHHRVRFLGYQSSKVLAEYYAKVDFLIHPTLTESFSMTLLEAMSTGLPIVASDVGGIPELVEHNINGILIPPGNVDALSSAITTMCADVDKRIVFSHNNRKKILDTFTWEKISTQYLSYCADEFAAKN